MAIHPDDLERMNFPSVRRGFDQAEVRSYLFSLAATIRHDSRLADTTNQPSTETARNDAKAILLAAQETAESIRSEARSQATQIRQKAQLEADQMTASRASAAATMTPAFVQALPPKVDTSEAERRLQNKVRQLEALRAEVERLHVESGKAVRIASDERRAAERVRAESIDEIARLRQEVNSLQTQAVSVSAAGNGFATSNTRSDIPGAVDHAALHIDTRAISVIDSSATAPAMPLVEAVKSAVGRAMKH